MFNIFFYSLTLLKKFKQQISYIFVYFFHLFFLIYVHVRWCQALFVCSCITSSIISSSRKIKLAIHKTRVGSNVSHINKQTPHIWDKGRSMNDETLEEWRYYFQRILIPCVVIIGILGNFVNVIVLTRCVFAKKVLFIRFTSIGKQKKTMAEGNIMKIKRWKTHMTVTNYRKRHWNFFISVKVL